MTSSLFFHSLTLININQHHLNSPSKKIIQPQIINSTNVEQIKEMILNAFATSTDFFKVTRAQGNNNQNKVLILNKAVETWLQYFGRYGYLIMRNKNILEHFTKDVLKVFGKKLFAMNKIEIIIKALNSVIEKDTVNNDDNDVITIAREEVTIPQAVGEEEDREEEEEDLLNTSCGSLFGNIPNTMTANLDELLSEIDFNVVTSSTMQFASHEKRTLEERIDELVKENEALRFQNNINNIIIDNQSTEEKNRENNQLMDDIDSLQDQIVLYKNQILVTHNKVRSVEAERETYKKQVEDISLEVNHLRIEKESIGKDMENIKETFGNDMASLQNQLDAKNQFSNNYNAYTQCKQLRMQMELLEKSLMNTNNIVEIHNDNIMNAYDAETVVLEQEYYHLGKRKRQDSLSSDVSSTTKTSKNIAIAIMNKLTYQAMIDNESSKPFRTKINSLYTEFANDKKFLKKIMHIFVKVETKHDSEVVGKQAGVMKVFLKNLTTV